MSASRSSNWTSTVQLTVAPDGALQPPDPAKTHRIRLNTHQPSSEETDLEVPR
ncbi:hypothetical protein AB0C22_23175 [Micromonospora sp. NPDC048894]|uniref:hypothetical protein n=1 Tax=Micromonospora sp. NPDC048894 TaxID=3155493 RepID=UPI0033DDB7BE